MTGTELQDYVEKRLGRTFEPDSILEAITEGLDEIGDLGLLYATSDVTVDDTKQWYSLPDSYSRIKKVIKFDRGKEYIYEQWEYRNGTIRLFHKGDYRIVARKMPEYITEIAEPITDLHRSYNNALKYYVLAWVRENEDLDDTTSQHLYEKFEKKVIRAAETLISTKAPARVRVIRDG